MAVGLGIFCFFFLGGTIVRKRFQTLCCGLNFEVANSFKGFARLVHKANKILVFFAFSGH